MSAADKYGKAMPELLNAESLKQVHAAGQKLADNAMVQEKALGNTVPAPTPANKYGSGGGKSIQKDLPPPSRTL